MFAWIMSLGFCFKQESLTNVNVSARQQCVYEGPYGEIYDKSALGT